MLFLNWICKLLGYKKEAHGGAFRAARRMERLRGKKRRFDYDRNEVHYTGQINMEAVHDRRGLRCFVMGGFCVEIDSLDTDKMIPGIDENGWNGMMNFSMDGNGQIRIEQEQKLDDDEFMFWGDINLPGAGSNYIPYHYYPEHPTGYFARGVQHNFPKRYNLRDVDEVAERAEWMRNYNTYVNANTAATAPTNNVSVGSPQEAMEEAEEDLPLREAEHPPVQFRSVY